MINIVATSAYYIHHVPKPSLLFLERVNMNVSQLCRQFDRLEFRKPDPTTWPILRPSDYVGKLSHLLRIATRPFRENILRILLKYVFPLPMEVRRSCVEGTATLYNSIMEHAATVIICKKNPNVSESDVSRYTKIRAPETYQNIYRTEVNRDKGSGELGWSI